MTVEEKVQAVLAAAAGVTALVPAARISVPGDLQEVARPYLVHQIVTTTESIETHNDGLVNLKFWAYQVACFADSYSSARAVALAVRNALGSYREGGIVSHWTRDHLLPYEPNIRVTQIVCEFEIADMLV